MQSGGSIGTLSTQRSPFGIFHHENQDIAKRGYLGDCTKRRGGAEWGRVWPCFFFQTVSCCSVMFCSNYYHFPIIQITPFWCWLGFVVIALGNSCSAKVLGCTRVLSLAAGGGGPSEGTDTLTTDWCCWKTRTWDVSHYSTFVEVLYWCMAMYATFYGNCILSTHLQFGYMIYVLNRLNIPGYGL